MTDTHRYDFSTALWTARLATLIVILAIAAVFFGEQQFGRRHEPAARHALAMMLALQLPFAVAGLMIARGPSRFGLGLAAAAAITLLVPLVPAALLSVLFIGSSGVRHVWTPYSMAALVPVLGVLAIAAVLALRGATPPGQRARALGLGFAASLACAAAIVGLAKWLEANDRQHHFDLYRDDQTAEALVAQVARCARSFAEAHPVLGYPPDLVSLGPRGSQCLPEAKETQGGFRLIYLASPPGIDGQRRSFSICSRPLRYLGSGVGTFVSDSTGLTPEPIGMAPDATDAMACGIRWYGNEYRGSSLLFCLLSYAAAHPDQGFPRTLQDVSDCQREWKLRQWDYRPGPPGPDGRIVSYEAEWVQIGDPAWVTDETGVLRSGR